MCAAGRPDCRCASSSECQSRSHKCLGGRCVYVEPDQRTGWYGCRYIKRASSRSSFDPGSANTVRASTVPAAKVRCRASAGNAFASTTRPASAASTRAVRAMRAARVAAPRWHVRSACVVACIRRSSAPTAAAAHCRRRGRQTAPPRARRSSHRRVPLARCS